MDSAPDQPSTFDQLSTFDQWRVVPNDETLLFNFKDTVDADDEAIGIIIACYGRESIMGIRPLCSKSIEDWIVIEVCFASKEARTKAITKGVTYSHHTVFPITTGTLKVKYTVLYFKGMCLYSDQAQIENDIRVWVDYVLNDARKTARATDPYSLYQKKIKGLWMVVDELGLYRGDCVAIIPGVDKKFMETYDKFGWYFPDAAVDYPRVRLFVNECYMYCTNCKSIDSHATSDCEAIRQRASEVSWMKYGGDENTQVDVDEETAAVERQLKEKLSMDPKMEEEAQHVDEEADYCCVDSIADIAKK